MVARVRVIVVNYNAGADLERCAAALAEQSFADFEAVIADNGSTDGALQALAGLDARFRVLSLATNLGFAAANNRGAAGAETEWLATLNPDAFPEPGWLGALLAATARFPDVTMFGSTQIDDGDPSRLDGSGDAYFAAGFPWRGNHGHAIEDLPADGETFAPCAAAALYRTTEFLAAGGFDERFFCYCEDVDLAFRQRLTGARCIQVRDAVVRHVGSGLTGARSDFTLYHSARNRLWTLFKNVPGALLVPMIPAHLAVTLFISATALRHGGLASIWRGLRDGVTGLGPIWAERRRLQHARAVSWWSIARAFTWSPLRFRRRGHDVRPP
ncbi:MAG: glycosyltransferase family 2 protein [Alphaproteobacteria bacterium]|jgi:GT2 family glycosyltransferase|nr:glycosyltransferase family 2 protein [Alphaproteobacteria bacterium]